MGKGRRLRNLQGSAGVSVLGVLKTQSLSEWIKLKPSWKRKG